LPRLSAFPLGTSLFRRHLIADAGAFDPRLTYGENWLLTLRISLLTPIDYIEAETYVLRRQGASLMRSPRHLSAKTVEGLLVAQPRPGAPHLAPGTALARLRRLQVGRHEQRLERAEA